MTALRDPYMAGVWGAVLAVLFAYLADVPLPMVALVGFGAFVLVGILEMLGAIHDQLRDIEHEQRIQTALLEHIEHRADR